MHNRWTRWETWKPKAKKKSKNNKSNRVQYLFHWSVMRISLWASRSNRNLITQFKCEIVVGHLILTIWKPNKKIDEIFGSWFHGCDLVELSKRNVLTCFRSIAAHIQLQKLQIWWAFYSHFTLWMIRWATWIPCSYPIGIWVL